MSSLEMHRFRSIDRALTPEEQKEIDTFSSRFSPTLTGVDYIYHYGSFKKDAEQVLLKYFDAMLYVDSWENTQLMFRFPRSLVNWKELTQFTNIFERNHLDFKIKGDYVLMDLRVGEEEGNRWIVEEYYQIDPLLSIREEILHGDYRALYLGWLMIEERRHFYDDKDWYEPEEEEEERALPPVPANLQHLSAAHEELIRIFEIDDHLVEATATVSPNTQKQTIDYRPLLLRLSDDEKEDFLLRLANGEKRLELELRRRLAELNDKEKDLNFGKSLDWGTLKELAAQKENAAEAARKEAERQAYIKKMEGLKKQKEQLWKDTADELSLKTGSGYEKGTALLVDLKALAVYENDVAGFEKRKEEFLEPYIRSQALLRRLRKVGLYP